MVFGYELVVLSTKVLRIILELFLSNIYRYLCVFLNLMLLIIGTAILDNMGR